MTAAREGVGASRVELRAARARERLVAGAMQAATLREQAARQVEAPQGLAQALQGP